MELENHSSHAALIHENCCYSCSRSSRPQVEKYVLFAFVMRRYKVVDLSVGVHSLSTRRGVSDEVSIAVKDPDSIPTCPDGDILTETGNGLKRNVHGAELASKL